MGIIVKDDNDNSDIYHFYIKGADSIMKEKVNAKNDKI